MFKYMKRMNNSGVVRGFIIAIISVMLIGTVAVSTSCASMGDRYAGYEDTSH